MNPELGHLALILAFCIALLQTVLPLWGAFHGQQRLLDFARHATLAQALCLALSFLSLSLAFLQGDFSVRYVADHSNTLLPWFYRLTAVWGSHEGSLLLWVLILAGWSVAVAVFSKNLPDRLVGGVLGFMGAISVGFLAFTLFTSNPFERLFPVPLEGHGLNPLLQDPGMIVHPPLLYMGYVGFAVSFAFAMAALAQGRLDAAWARWARPWVAVAWVFLTAGIAVGAFWAYYELGWGGWWFWDPVENASLMPWLVGTALLHSLAVTEKRGAFKHWTLLLAISAFALSLLGTFLVRSGVLTSVHAFATDPDRGQFLLSFLVVVVASSLLLYGLRAPKMQGYGRFALVSRETGLLANNVMLAAVTGCVLLGTLYPLFMDALNLGKISVGAAYFEAVFAPLMFPVVFLMVQGPFMRWKVQPVRPLLHRLGPWVAVSLVLAIVLAWVFSLLRPGMVMGLFLAVWVALGSALLLIERVRERHDTSLTAPPSSLARRLSRIPAHFWGMWLAHLGVGVFVLGVTLVNGLETHKEIGLGPGESAELGGYRFTLVEVSAVTGPNYDAVRAHLDVTREGRPMAPLYPEKRLYRIQGMPMTEVALDMGLWRDLYVALGQPLEGERWVFQLQIKPFISGLWIGCLLMALGGLLAAVDRRYRLVSRQGKTPCPSVP